MITQQIENFFSAQKLHIEDDLLIFTTRLTSLKVCYENLSHLCSNSSQRKRKKDALAKV